MGRQYWMEGHYWYLSEIVVSWNVEIQSNEPIIWIIKIASWVLLNHQRLRLDCQQVLINDFTQKQKHQID